MEKHKIIWEMYWVLLLIEQEFDELWIKEWFDKYYKKRVLELQEQAFDWRIEDEREKNQKISQ